MKNKKIISLILVFVLVITSCPIALAKHEEQYGRMRVSWFGDTENIDTITVMVKDGHVYADVDTLANSFDAVSRVNADKGNIIITDNFSDPAYLIVYENLDNVVLWRSHIQFDYKSPCKCVFNENGAWVPFQYTLKLLDSDYHIVSDVVMVHAPERNVMNTYDPLVTDALDLIEFDLFKELGGGELNAAICHLINMLNGLTEGDLPSMINFTTQYFGDTSAYDFKYADRIAPLFCSQSKDEVREISKYIDTAYGWIGDTGDLIRDIDEFYESNISNAEEYIGWLKKLIDEGNPRLTTLNKQAAGLENILKNQGRWQDISAPIRNVQNEVSKATSGLEGIIDLGVFALNTYSYYSEFSDCDVGAVSAMKAFANHIKSNETTSGAVCANALTNYANLSESDGGAAAYSATKAILGDLQNSAEIAEMLTGGSFDLSKRLFGTSGSAILLAWSIASNFIPCIKEGLDRADYCELSLYSQIMQYDAGAWMVEARTKLSKNPSNVELQIEFAKAAYSFLKLAYIARNAGIATAMNLDAVEMPEVKLYIEHLTAKNNYIAELLPVFLAASVGDDPYNFGFTKRAEKEFRKGYDDSLLVNAAIALYADFSDASEDYASFIGELMKQVGVSDYLPFATYLHDNTMPSGITVPEHTQGILSIFTEDLNKDGRNESYVLILEHDGSIDIRQYDVVNGSVSLTGQLAEGKAKVAVVGSLNIGLIGGRIVICSDYIQPPGYSRYGTETFIYCADSEGLKLEKKYSFYRIPDRVNGEELVSCNVYFSCDETEMPQNTDEIIERELSELGIIAENVKVGFGSNLGFGLSFDCKYDKLVMDAICTDNNEGCFCTVTDYTDVKRLNAGDAPEKQPSIVDDAVDSKQNWVIEPGIAAEDIAVIRCQRPTSLSNGELDFNSKGKHMYDGICAVKQNNLWGVISYSGLVLSDAAFIEIYAGYGKEYLLRTKNDVIYTLTDLYELRKISEDEALRFMGTAPDDELVWINSKNGIYLRLNDGTVLDDPYQFSGTTAVRFFVDENNHTDDYVVVSGGKRVNSDIYNEAGHYIDGVIPVKKDGKWGYIDNSGKTVLPFEFDGCWDIHGTECVNGFNGTHYSQWYAYDASNGYIVARKDGEYAVFDTDGNIVLDYGVYDEIRPIYKGLFWAKDNGKWGVASLTDGQSVVNAVSPEKKVADIVAKVSTSDGLRMREGPGTEYRVIGVLSGGSQVVICGNTRDWSYINYNDVYGWVKSSYLSS